MVTNFPDEPNLLESLMQALAQALESQGMIARKGQMNSRRSKILLRPGDPTTYADSAYAGEASCEVMRERGVEFRSVENA